MVVCALLLLALGGALAALSLLGPLGSGAIEYRIADEIITSQLLGLDAVSLALVVPLALGAAALAWRAHPAWPVAAIGPAVYVAYMIPQYLLGPDHVTREGDNEAFFPLFLALFVLAVVAGLWAWSALDLERLPTAPRAERLVARVLLPLAAVVVFVRYLPSLADVMGGAPESEEYRAGPGFFWTIAWLDLGLALPATVAAIAGVARGAAWGRRALYAVVPWYALVGVAVGAMAVAMAIRDDPGASAGGAAAMCALGLALAGMAAVLLAPLRRGARADPRRAG
jgi:hypothetical protein